MRRFEDKSVLVTGGTGALGGAVVREFLKEGATVTVLYRNEPSLKALRESLGELAWPLDALRAELTHEQEVSDALRATIERRGRLDVLVNVAGGYLGGVSLERLSTSDWDRVLDVNLRSTFYVCRAAVPYMRAQRRGRIINVASRAGLRGVASMSAYSVAKGGVIRLTEALAEELQDDGITVNCVLPSIMDTPANRSAMPKANPSRWVSTESVARVILFLASDDAEVVNGAAIPVYGRA